ncbi:MAG: MBL fold metallo-hydrolase, partial [Solirubrobacteraceae bacterium]
ARSAGVPEEPLARYMEARRAMPSGIARVAAPDRDLVDGVSFETDLGTWEVVETPGHAPSHVCLWQPDRRLLISGDHLLGRVSLYYDHGYTPDPTGEFLASLDRVEDLGARLCLSGHGRTFTDVVAHITANRELVARRIGRLLDVLRFDGPISAFDAVPRVYDQAVTPMTAQWWLSETLCYLTHLEATGRAAREGGDPDRWRAA